MSPNDVNASLLKDIDPIGSANRLCAVSFQDDIAQLRFGNSFLLVDPTNSQLQFFLIASNNNKTEKALNPKLFKKVLSQNIYSQIYKTMHAWRLACRIRSLMSGKSSILNLTPSSINAPKAKPLICWPFGCIDPSWILGPIGSIIGYKPPYVSTAALTISNLKATC